MRWFFSFVAALLIAVTISALGQETVAPTSEPSSIEKEILRLEQEWSAADLRNDDAAAERYQAKDLTLINEDGELLTKREYDAEEAADSYKINAYVLTYIKVHVYGDNVAVVTGLSTVGKGTHRGKDFSGQFRYTNVWVKGPEGWQIVSSQCTPVKVKK